MSQQREAPRLRDQKIQRGQLWIRAIYQVPPVDVLYRLPDDRQRERRRGHRARGIPARRQGRRRQSPKAYLATIATRLAIDHLRSARVRRESYVGTWLPEPLIGDGFGGFRDETDPAELAETSDSLLDGIPGTA